MRRERRDGTAPVRAPDVPATTTDRPSAGALGRLLAGLVVLGAAISAQKQAGLGLGPWDVLHDGIARHAGVDLGIVGIAVGIPIMFLWWPLRQRPGVGTLLNLALVGVVIHVLLDHTSPAHATWLRVALLAGSLVLVAVGSGLYLSPDLGAGPRDGLMVGIHRRFGYSIRLTRTLLELSALVAGIALGGSAGVGTVLFALMVGPMVQVALHRFGFPAGQREVVGDEPGDALGLVGE